MLENLTNRENEVAKLLMLGNSQKEAANQLHVSTDTLNTHVKNIYLKTGVNKLSQLIALVLRERYNIMLVVLIAIVIAIALLTDKDLAERMSASFKGIVK